MNQPNRRRFLQSATASAVAVSTASSLSGATVASTEETFSAPFVRNRIAVSTYSFFTFRGGSKLTMPQCIDTAAKMGFDGVELLLVQMEDTSDAFLQKLKRQAFVNGLDLCGMSTHQGFVRPDKTYRDENIKRRSNKSKWLTSSAFRRSASTRDDGELPSPLKS